MSSFFVIPIFLLHLFTCQACPFIGDKEKTTNNLRIHYSMEDHGRIIQRVDHDHLLPPDNESPIHSQSPPTESPTQTLRGNTNYDGITPTKKGICTAYHKVLSSFKALLPADSSKPSDKFQRSKILAKALRLAFHDIGEIDIRTTDLLGPDGCLSDSDENAGLLTDSIVDTLFEPIYQANRNFISRADFWALLGWLAVDIGSDGHATILYQYGRKDAESCPVSSPRLPSAQLGHDYVIRYFRDQLGLTPEDAVNLMGGHTLGFVHQEFSGYGFEPTPTTVTTEEELQTNAWDTTPHIFDNEYYRSMVEVGWENRGGEKTIWRSYRHQTIMLNTDMVLGFSATATTTAGQHCGPYSSGNFVGCTNPDNNEQPATVELIQSYIGDGGNSIFLKNFAVSFKKLLSVGYGTGSSKLGADLVDLDLTTC